MMLVTGFKFAGNGIYIVRNGTLSLLGPYELAHLPAQLYHA
jgi:hypothetical protein